MSLTFDTKTYTNDVARSPDSYRYLGPDHTSANKDYVDFVRTAPSPTLTYLGKGRARVKMVRTQENVLGDNLGELIFDVALNIPVGTLDAEQDAAIDELAVWLATTSAKDFLKAHILNQ